MVGCGTTEEAYRARRWLMGPALARGVNAERVTRRIDPVVGERDATTTFGAYL